MSPLRLIVFGLAALIVALQYPLWFGNGGVFAVWKLKREIAAQRAENDGLRDRNQALGAEVVDLKKGLAAIEERARIELGMIKKDETFFQVIEPEPADAPE
jgi:cell division protein FtsB